MSVPQQRRWANRAVARALNLRSNERRPVALLWAHSFFLGTGVAYLVSAALPIFLAAFPIDYLPGAFAAAAALEFLVSYASERLENAVGQARMLRLVLLLLVAGTVALRLTMFHSGPTASLAIAFGLLVWSRLLNYVSDDEFWTLSSRLFDVRQSKRLFSLIDSGSFLAKILGYFSVPLLLNILQVPDLLIFSSLGTAASVYFLQRIVRNYGHALEHHAADSSHPVPSSSTKHVPKHQSAFGFLRHNNYLASVAMVTFSAIVAMTCIDYGFLREIELRSMNMAQIARFLGIFLGVAQLASLILKVGLVGRLFNKFGLARTSVVLPIGLFAITAGGLAATATSMATTMIWSFTAAMLLVELWSDAVHVPALAIALQPLDVHERHRAQQTIGGVVEPMALGIAALLLYALSVGIGFTLRGISLAMLGMFVAWAMALFWFGREYKATILRALKHRWLQSAELTWDAPTRRMITEKLRSPYATEAEYALRLVPATEPSFFVDALPILLDHKDQVVRLAALQRIDAFVDKPAGMTDLAHESSTKFSTDDRDRVRGMLQGVLHREQENPTLLGQALRASVAVHQDFSAEQLKSWLDDKRLPVREGLLAGLIKYGEVEGMLIAGEHLQVLLHSPLVRERMAAAEIVGRVGLRQFYQPLLSLLADESSDIRVAAIRASALVAHPDLIEPLLDQYLQLATANERSSASHELLSSLEIALRAIAHDEFGNAMMPHLARRIEGGQIDGSRLQRLTRLLGYWGNMGVQTRTGEDRSLAEQSVSMLTAFLHWPLDDRSFTAHHRVLGKLRMAALHSLVGASPTMRGIEVSDKALLNQIIGEELDRARHLIAILQLTEGTMPPTGTRPATLLFRSALSYEIAQASERVLLLLALACERQTVLRVRDSFMLGDARHRANAFETLEHLLPSTLSKPIIALLETSFIISRSLHVVNDRSATGVILTDLLPPELRDAKLSNESALDWLIDDTNRFYEPWTIATALYWAGLCQLDRFSKNIEKAAALEDLPGQVARMIASKEKQPSNFYHYSKEGEPMPVLFERVILLKTVDLFRETPDPVLAHVAKALEEVHAARGETIIHKGEIGHCLYIIVEGRVSVHDGEHKLSELGSRDVVGELALLDPEPRSASVTALEETSLLRLDREVFFDLMVDNLEIARGAIATLCRRIRRQNEQIASSTASGRLI